MRALVNKLQYDEIALTEVTTHSTVIVNGTCISKEAVFYVDTAVDLTVTQTVDKYLGHVLEKLSYSITIVNNGPQNSTNVILTDILPSNVILSSVTLSQGKYSRSDGKITFYLGTIKRSELVKITVTIIPKIEGIIKNYIFATCNEHDIDLNNNSYTKVTRITSNDS